uniref:(northern house mosquito) hypothetical protein n=1 Tax=Culex pipiens TaxID=7175 RepID=A0A8D8J3X4_CULPI
MSTPIKFPTKCSVLSGIFGRSSVDELLNDLIPNSSALRAQLMRPPVAVAVTRGNPALYPTRSRQDRLSCFGSRTGLNTTLDRFWLTESFRSTSRLTRLTFGLAIFFAPKLVYNGTKLFRTMFLREADPLVEPLRRRNSGVAGFRDGFDGPSVTLLSFLDSAISLVSPGLAPMLNRLFQNCFNR